MKEKQCLTHDWRPERLKKATAESSNAKIERELVTYMNEVMGCTYAAGEEFVADVIEGKVPGLKWEGF